MKNNYPYLTDTSFLLDIDLERLKDQYVKIIVLNFDEKPIREIQGRVLSGNINIDGNSAVRRTCNLSMVALENENDLTNIDKTISINKKISVEIGFKNTTNKYKDFDIIWYPLGIFVIISPSITHNLVDVNISLTLKDKMCLLNGECGGILPASVTFHEYDTVNENGEYITVKPTIYQIIQELVNHFGGEQLGKILIADVDTKVKQVMKWTGNSPFYIMHYTDGQTQFHPTTNMDTIVGFDGPYNEFMANDDVGFIYVDFTYPGELIGNAGDTVVTILDKIKNTLGNYEYFYNVNGEFIFQEKKNYLNVSQSTVVLNKLNNEDYLINLSSGKSVYTFDKSNLVTSYINTPQYGNIKNDFIVWGKRKTASGNKFPIRYHLAIDEKPRLDNSYKVFLYKDEEDLLIKAKTPMPYPNKTDFPQVGLEEVFYWDETGNKIYKWNPADVEYQEIGKATGEDGILQEITPKDWRTVLYLQGAIAEPFGTESNYYYTELKNEWPKLYDLEKQEFFSDSIQYPCDIDFFLDFIDSAAAISELSINNIGRRTKVIIDDSVNCVFEKEIPDLILIDNSTSEKEQQEVQKMCNDRGQDFIKLDGSQYAMLNIGGTKNSAYNLVRELLYQYTSYNESISISCIPIYHLEPNTRITVLDPETGINGDYMINTISVPFDISGTMNISCTRALERL